MCTLRHTCTCNYTHVGNFVHTWSSGNNISGQCVTNIRKYVCAIKLFTLFFIVYSSFVLANYNYKAF